MLARGEGMDKRKEKEGQERKAAEKVRKGREGMATWREERRAHLQQ